MQIMYMRAERMVVSTYIIIRHNVVSTCTSLVPRPETVFGPGNEANSVHNIMARIM